MEWLSGYTEKEIEEVIEKLTSFQKKIFDEKLKETNDRRYALYFAKSYPNDL